jgi:hypothetical protein
MEQSRLLENPYLKTSEITMTSTAHSTYPNFTMASALIKLVSNSFLEIADYCAYKSNGIARLYDKTIGGDYREEYERSGINKATNILHIGCGSYPLTEMALVSVSKGQVTGIDKNPKTVTKAVKIIERRGLANRISIRHGDGRTFPVSGYDTIIVSSCSLPKSEILQHLADAAQPQAHIIVREVDIASPNIEAFLATHPSMVVSDRIHHNPFPFIHPIGWTTYQIQKQ